MENIPHDSPSREEIELPRTGRLLSDFAREVGSACSRNGVFLIDGVPVVLPPKSDRVEDLMPECFRTYVEKNMVCFKLVRAGRAPDGSQIWERGLNSMNREQAAAVLHSHDFLGQQREIRAISSIPVPILREGKLVLHAQEYDPGSQILVRELTK